MPEKALLVAVVSTKERSSARCDPITISRFKPYLEGENNR